jgi:hypothetical protein
MSFQKRTLCSSYILTKLFRKMDKITKFNGQDSSSVITQSIMTIITKPNQQSMRLNKPLLLKSTSWAIIYTDKVIQKKLFLSKNQPLNSHNSAKIYPRLSGGPSFDVSCCLILVACFAFQVFVHLYGTKPLMSKRPFNTLTNTTVKSP